MKLLSLMTLLLACATTLNAQVYSYVDSNGNTVYTDNPPKQQQTRKLEIELIPSVSQAKINTGEEEIKTVRLSPNKPAETVDIATVDATPTARNITAPFTVNTITSYQFINIVKPQNEETIRNSAGQLTIEVESEPNLATEHLYRYVIDGKEVGESRSNVFDVASLERGEHTLIVEIINTADQQVLTQSKEQLFHIKQTTLAEKRRIRPCLIREYGIRPECPLKDKPKPQPRNLLLKLTDLSGLTKSK